MFVSIALSVEVLTDRAILIVVFSVVALLAAGWRKPARASVRSPRAAAGRTDHLPRYGVPVERQPIAPERRTGILRRLFALVTTGALAVITGTVIAIVLAAASIWGVINLTDLLGR